MNYIKSKERSIKAKSLIAGLKSVGANATHIQEYCKWAEVTNGRLQVSMHLWGIKMTDGKDAYFLEDSLGRVACALNDSKEDITNWLAKHNYKTDKQWYLEDYGMDEETWEEWNK